jgi:hypothetical protein
MALTPRKKKGIGFFISGAVFVTAGLLSMFATEDPTWFSGAIGFIGLIASYFGFQVVFPDND